MRLRSMAVAGALVGALVALAGACSSSGDGRTDDTSPAAEVPTVAIVGDSITEQGQDVLRGRLGEGRDLTIDGKSGYTILQQLPAAAALAQANPSQAIVNLGTNDVWRGRSVAQIAADLEAVIEEFSTSRCVHLVTIAEDMGDSGTGTDWSAVATDANAAMVELAARHDGVDVVDWADRLQDHDAAGETEGSLLTDTVHPTELGQEALADLYEVALDSCGD